MNNKDFVKLIQQYVDKGLINLKSGEKIYLRQNTQTGEYYPEVVDAESFDNSYLIYF